jgi:hypothetical protein
VLRIIFISNCAELFCLWFRLAFADPRNSCFSNFSPSVCLGDVWFLNIWSILRLIFSNLSGFFCLLLDAVVLVLFKTHRREHQSAAGWKLFGY